MMRQDIAESLNMALTGHGARLAIVDAARAITYQDLDHLIDDLARRILAAAVQAGDR